MHEYHYFRNEQREIPFQWDFAPHRREKTEHGRAPRWGAKLNRNDTFLNRRGKGKPQRR